MILVFQKKSGPLWKKSLSTGVLRSKWRNYSSISLKKISEMHFFPNSYSHNSFCKSYFEIHNIPHRLENMYLACCSRLQYKDQIPETVFEVTNITRPNPHVNLNYCQIFHRFLVLRVLDLRNLVLISGKNQYSTITQSKQPLDLHK